MKTLNIEMNVRRMEAQNIMTASANIGGETDKQLAPERGVVAPAAGGAGAAGANAGVAPVRAGF